MDWIELQEQHKAWLTRNYPAQPAEIPAAGVVEESGELLHAVLKLRQEKLWGQEPRQGDLHGKLIDAVGDCAIYACSMCSSLNWNFEELLYAAGSAHPNVSILHLARELVAKALEATKEPYKKQRVAEYLTQLRCVASAYCDAPPFFEQCVETTWAKVSKRNRQPKVVCLCGSTRFKDRFVYHNLAETMAGNVVLSVGFFGLADGEPTADVKARLDELHKRKIDMSNEVVVIRPVVDICDECGKPWAKGECSYHSDSTHRGGYIGDSTASEIAYAEAHGKPVRYVE